MVGHCVYLETSKSVVNLLRFQQCFSEELACKPEWQGKRIQGDGLAPRTSELLG